MFADTVCLPPTSMCSFQSVNVHVHKPCVVLSLILQINISSIHCMHVLMAHVSYDANLTSYSGVLHWYAAQPPPPPPPTHLQLAVHYFLIGAPAHTHEPVLGLHRCIMTYGGTPQMFKGGSP